KKSMINSAKHNHAFSDIINLSVPVQTARIWTINLNVEEKIEKKLHSTLSFDERIRANRFRNTTHKKHYIAVRGVLRQLLGYYLHIPPQSIIFNYNNYQKPSLAFPNSLLHFNISHSG